MEGFDLMERRKHLPGRDGTHFRSPGLTQKLWTVRVSWLVVEMCVLSGDECSSKASRLMSTST